MIHLAGRETITEVLNGLKFDLSARAFLQANPEMTSILYEQAFKALDLKGDEKLVDAYSGVGTIGLSVAKQVREVRGMDTIAEAVENANANSVRNGILTVYTKLEKLKTCCRNGLKAVGHLMP